MKAEEKEKKEGKLFASETCDEQRDASFAPNSTSSSSSSL